MNAPKAILAMMVISLVFMASLGFAAQDRRPVDNPVPPIPNEQPTMEVCDVQLVDNSCNASGDAQDAVYYWALSQAGYECQEAYNSCVTSQAQEWLANETICQAAGCTLLAEPSTDACEHGGPLNCSPRPGDEKDPSNTVFDCIIKGKYNVTNYQCVRPISPKVI